MTSATSSFCSANRTFTRSMTDPTENLSKCSVDFTDARTHSNGTFIRPMIGQIGSSNKNTLTRSNDSSGCYVKLHCDCLVSIKKRFLPRFKHVQETSAERISSLSERLSNTSGGNVCSFL